MTPFLSEKHLKKFEVIQMKNEIEKIDDIIIDKFTLLTMLDRRTQCLISSKNPVKQRLAIWQKDFKKFKSLLAKQDKTLIKMILS